MKFVHALLVLAAVFRLDPCGGAEDEETTPAEDGKTPPPGGQTTTPPAGQTTTPPGGQTTTPPAGTTGGRCKATTPPCNAFTIPGGWDFTTVSSYTAGQEPKVTGLSGNVKFGIDGKFVEDYVVGSLSFNNHYEGTYTMDGAFFTGITSEGEKLEYIIACDNVTIAITVPDADCKPSLILGGTLVAK